MKRIISLVLVMTMLLSMPVSTYADNIENKQPTSMYGDAMLEYLKTDNHKLLVVRGNYGYMQFADDFRQNVFSLYLLEMIDMLIETGTEPDQQKYMEVLINIIATYDLDNAADISEQNSMDNLKSLEDYAMDFVEMGANAVSVMVGNNPVATEFENNISTAIDRISVLKDNTNDWIEALSDLETIVQSYDKHDRFLELIENNAEGDLKIAASTLRMGMKKAFQIKLDTYADISDKNFENYSELFFEDVFWKALKEIPEYETDETLKAFVDSGDSFVSKLDLLENSWELGLGIGKLVGNVTVGGEDLINRVMEILALYDISSILQVEVSELGVEFFETIGTEREADIIEEYGALAQYLIGCRVRGEYCLYSIVANDAGLLSWFNKESAEEAKIWYEYKVGKILDIQAELSSWIFSNLSEGDIGHIETKLRTKEEYYSANLEDWKLAYLDYLFENGMEIEDWWSETYMLVNINNDDIPELYINYGSVPEGAKICSYYNGSVIYQHLSNYGFSYIEGQNLFIDSGGHMDVYYDKIYSISDGMFELKYDGQYGAIDNSDVQYDSEGYPIYNYYWNENEVSDEVEYQKLLNAEFKKEKARDPYEGAEYNSELGRVVGSGICDYEEIIKVIVEY